MSFVIKLNKVLSPYCVTMMYRIFILSVGILSLISLNLDEKFLAIP